MNFPRADAFCAVKDTSRETDAAIELAASRWIGRLDAGMTAAEKIELERWKAADPRHARAFARHEQTWRSFDQPKAAGLADTMVDALAASRARRQRRKVRGLVGGVTLCVLAGLLWHQGRIGATAGSEDRDVQLAARAVVTLPEKRTLPEGSVIDLKPGAEIRIEFGSASRRVLLERGEAYFQVAKHSLPFIVSAQGVEVRAVGTAFSVQLGGQAVEVVVAEGRVSVERPAAAAPANAAPSAPARAVAPQTLANVEASNRFVVELDHRTPTPAAVLPVTSQELAAHLAWRTARLEFTDTPLETAVEFFNRYSTQGAAARLVVDPNDVALARSQVSGYFRADNVDAFLILVEQSLGLKADREDGRIILRRAR